MGRTARFTVRPETRLATTSATTNGNSVGAWSPSCHRGGQGLEEASRAGEEMLPRSGRGRWGAPRAEGPRQPRRPAARGRDQAGG